MSSENASSSSLAWVSTSELPALDSWEGAAFAAAVACGLVYILLLVGEYSAMIRIAFDVTALSLLVSLISGFALSAMLGSDISTYQRLELELARTVLAYVASGSPPASDAPLAGVWRAHVAASEEARRMARAHSYALGLFTVGGVLSLAALLLSSLGMVTSTPDVRGLGMLVEWFAFVFLVAGAVAVLASVGYTAPISAYERLAPRRWRRNSGRQQAVDGAISEIAWLAEFSRGARESRMSPGGPSIIPSWRE
jgi:hypothetical protein